MDTLLKKNVDDPMSENIPLQRFVVGGGGGGLTILFCI